MKQKEVYWLGNVKMNEQIYKSTLEHFAKELELTESVYLQTQEKSDSVIPDQNTMVLS